MNYEEKWQAERERAGFLALADGAVFRGVAFGAREDRLGEAVFNTGMSGYQEIATDPSYAGQIVALTTAEVGNYGTNPDDAESRGLFLSGLVVNDLAEPSNFRSTLPLDRLLADAGVPVLRGLDTRSLTLHLRDHGSQKAYLHASNEPLDPAEAVERARAWEGLDGQDYAARVSCKVAYDFASDLRGEVESVKGKGKSGGQDETLPFTLSTLNSTATSGAERPLVAVYDFGVKRNILRSLASFARVRVVPAKTPAEEVLALKPAGVFLSNGPADPAALPYAIENVRKLLGIRIPNDQSSHGRANARIHAMRASTPPMAAFEAPNIPIMGICLGHQLLALACGAKTGRLAFGHHGCNHPVKELATGKVQITSQNHNFAVLADSLPPELEVTHLNLNDGTIEGLRHKTLPAFSVQYHPEACPGPHDAAPLFDRFRVLLASRAPAAR